MRYSKLFRPDTAISEGAKPRACLSRYPADRAGRGFPRRDVCGGGRSVPPSRRHPAWYYILGYSRPFLARVQAKSGPLILIREKRGRIFLRAVPLPKRGCHATAQHVHPGAAGVLKRVRAGGAKRRWPGGQTWRRFRQESRWEPVHADAPMRMSMPAACATKIGVKTCAVRCRLKLASFDRHSGIATFWDIAPAKSRSRRTEPQTRH
jgi:hypothetical protein